MSAAASVLLTYTLHSVALGGLALLSSLLLRRYPGLRCTIWKSVLIAPIFTSTFVVAIPTNGTVSLPSVIGRLAKVTPATVDVEVRLTRGMPPSRIERVRDPVGMIVRLSLFGFAALGLVRGGSFLIRRRRFVQSVDRARATGSVSHPALRSVRAVETGFVIVPVALSSGVIALPTGFMAAGTESRRLAILLHEVAHVERRDPAWVDIGHLVTAMTPWQPLNRIILNQLERDVELAADALAVSLGAQVSALVEGLAYFSTRALSPSPSGAALVRPESALVHRAHGLIAGSWREPGHKVTAATVFAVATLTLSMIGFPVISASAAGPGSAGPYNTEIAEIVLTSQQPSH